MEKLKMHTNDFASVYSEKIAQLFPECVTEVLDNQRGGVKSAIDFDKLKQLLATDVIEGSNERYQFTWPDKKKAIRMANAPSNMTLRPSREESVNFDSTENLYIEGDNLEVLKLLREDYLGKVKVIYIDPPYNTGSDFVYEDDFSQSIEDYLGKSGQSDSVGNKLVHNPESNGRFHTDWLNMLYPRLKVSKDLLSDDGVILISIDENEVDNLSKLCNEIFGENNCVGKVVWERAFAPKNDAKYLSDSHDYICIYAKNINYFQIGLLPRTEEANARYKNPDNDPKGPWSPDNMTVKTYSAAYDYEITTPNGTIMSPPNGRCWFTSKERMQKLIDEGRVWFGEDGGNMPRLKRYLSDVQQGMTPTTIWKYTDVGHNQEGRQEVKSLFDGKGYFDGPKPLRLMERILTVANSGQDDIVLDFFSGSATTAHAVMNKNANDGGHRRFILVQLPEDTDPKSEAFKSGYTNICEIGKERIRRAGKKILEEQAAAESEGGLFAQSESKPKVDVGFRVLKLDSSNMQDVYYRPEESSESTLFEDNIKPDRTPEDLLFQVMLECNLPLSAKIETKKIAGKDVFSVNNGYLMACFDADINEDVIKEVAKMKPYYFILRDSSLSSDNVADNFDQIFQAYSKETIRRVL